MINDYSKSENNKLEISSMSKYRILAVDDDPNTLEIIELTLSETYEIVPVYDSFFVISLINDIEPDMIILDIMMPKMSGYQLLDAIKAIPKFTETPVMFLTAKSNTSDVKYGYKLGAVTYITKPFNPERLLKNIDSFFKYTPTPQYNKKFNFEILKTHLEKAGLKKLKKKIPPTEIIDKKMDGLIDFQLLIVSFTFSISIIFSLCPL